MDISMSVLQMKKLRFREINLSKILSLIIQDIDARPGQMNFEAPLTSFLRSRVIFLKYPPQMPCPCISSSLDPLCSTQASNMTAESRVSFLLHPNLISRHHPVTSAPRLYSNISPFLYSCVCFQLPPPSPTHPSCLWSRPFCRPAFFCSPSGAQLARAFPEPPSSTSPSALLLVSQRSHVPYDSIYHTELELHVDLALDTPNTPTHPSLNNYMLIKCWMITPQAVFLQRTAKMLTFTKHLPCF